MRSEREEFEALRLELFDSLGASMEPVHLQDSRKRTIYALDRGTGRPLIFVHGGLSQAGEWATLVPWLQTGRRIILVDRPGCGLSYPIDYTGLNFRQEAVSFMASVVDALGLDRADLVGNSMGGFFCLAFALASPERTASLALVGAPAGLSKYLPRMVRLLAMPGVGPMLLSADLTIEQQRRRLYGPLLVAQPDRCPAALIDVGLQAAKLPGCAQTSATMLRNVVGITGWRRLIRHEVAKLPVRTRFVWGDRDVFESAASGAKLAAQMPHAEFVPITGAGHIPWHDAPEACATALLDFWAESPAVSPLSRPEATL